MFASDDIRSDFGNTVNTSIKDDKKTASGSTISTYSSDFPVRSLFPFLAETSNDTSSGSILSVEPNRKKNYWPSDGATVLDKIPLDSAPTKVLAISANNFHVSTFISEVSMDSNDGILLYRRFTDGIDNHSAIMNTAGSTRRILSIPISLKYALCTLTRH